MASAAATSTAPTTQAWESSGVTTTLEASLTLNPTAPAPSPATLAANELLIEVLSAALNPADYKVAELGLVSKLAFRGRPYVPGMDFCGRVVAAHHPSVSGRFKEGSLVFGAIPNQPRPKAGGSLSRLTVARADQCAPVPDGDGVVVVAPDDAAAVGIAGLSALGALQQDLDNRGPGADVLIVGGSGGVGTFAVQMAKRGFGAAHVTATCSGANVELVKGLGADEVLDYRSVDVVEELTRAGRMYDLVVDNVGDPAQRLYENAGKFLKEGGSYVQVGASMSVAGFRSIAGRALTPRFLGGGERKFRLFTGKPRTEDLRRVGEWMKEGKVKAVIDQTFEFEDVPKAYEKLRQGRSRGKIVVHVGK